MNVLNVIKQGRTDSTDKYKHEAAQLDNSIGFNNNQDGIHRRRAVNQPQPTSTKLNNFHQINKTSGLSAWCRTHSELTVCYRVLNDQSSKCDVTPAFLTRI